MTTAAAVLVCALELLGRSAGSLPPIEFVDSPPPDASPTANGFVRHDVPKIFLIRSSEAVRSARCESRRSLLHLASVIVHEEWHVRNGSDERRAYEAQLTALLRLGAQPNDWIYRSVYRSMRTVLEAQKQAALRARVQAAEAAVASAGPP